MYQRGFFSRSALQPGLALLLALLAVLWYAAHAAAQDQTGQVQRLSGRLEPEETHAYLLRNLQPGDRINMSMRVTSGDLDPSIGIMDTSLTFEEAVALYQFEVDLIVDNNENLALAMQDLRDRFFLAWDDDSGEGYSADLEFVVPVAGDYRLFAGSSLSSLGRATSGGYELVVGLNTPDGITAETQPIGAPFVEHEQTNITHQAAVEESIGSITPQAPVTSLRLANMRAGETLFVRVEPTSDNLVPMVILRDFGGKPVETGNFDGQTPQATLEFVFTEDAANFTLDIGSVSAPDGTPTTGEFRALLGRNAPNVLSGTADVVGGGVLMTPIDVQVGVRIERISEVDSQGEDFTVLGSMRMDWTDPALAFSPDSCNCSVKIYTEKEFDRFLAEVQSVWPDFVFFNQQGNRWVQSRTAAIWPDGRARYGESFTMTYQADFDFRKFPFDTQLFPIYLDMLLPANNYTVTELPGYSGINPEHGEDEFIITDFDTAVSTVEGRVTDIPVSRFSLTFTAPRHQNYYVLQVFVPILLIILISWFTFFLGDYTRRIEASAANILLFIAFSFSLTDNYPRLGYVTFLDAVMAVTFIFNTLVLLYNVYMKRLENQGQVERVAYIDRFLDWTYPFLYLGLIGIVALWFYWGGS